MQPGPSLRETVASHVAGRRCQKLNRASDSAISEQ